MSESLLVPLAKPQRDALRDAAAARGETVEALVGRLVAGFLARERAVPAHAPELASVLACLRARRDALRARGVAGLLVFGSVSRGEARARSDVDLLAELAPEGGPSLVGLASLRAELTDALGAPADLVDRAALRPEALVAAERDAVRAW